MPSPPIMFNAHFDTVSLIWVGASDEVQVAAEGSTLNELRARLIDLIQASLTAKGDPRAGHAVEVEFDFSSPPILTARSS